ncbi:hypothetical protein SERLA73DRAFT_44473, partial [Serpula lacrymans var. lacrymans S7.3]
PVHKSWMGAFTQDAAVCQRYYHAGVPVWYIRNEIFFPLNTNVVHIVNFTRPHHIITDHFHDNASKAFPLLYIGPGGEHHHFRLCQLSQCCFDPINTPQPPTGAFYGISMPVGDHKCKTVAAQLGGFGRVSRQKLGVVCGNLCTCKLEPH